MANLFHKESQFPDANTKHLVLGTKITPPFPVHTEQAVFGLGCFWGAEKEFWQLSNVYTTMVAYAGGQTNNPSYQQVCTGETGHCEVVGIIYNPQLLSYQSLLEVFWEKHNPTQGMRQGNDLGTQYRSVIYTTTEQQQSTAQQSLGEYRQKLSSAGFGKITTEIKTLLQFYYAEEYHQQYLIKNPSGYCPHHGTGVAY